MKSNIWLMALFKNKKQEEKKEKEAPKKDEAQSPVINSGDISWVIESPFISEKAFSVVDKNVYVFKVNKRANKKLIKEAIKKYYKVEPIKVNIVNLPPKKKISWKTGKVGKTASVKKAYVYLKDGDSISLI